MKPSEVAIWLPAERWQNSGLRTTAFVWHTEAADFLIQGVARTHSTTRRRPMRISKVSTRFGESDLRAESRLLTRVGLSNRRAESASSEKYPRGRDLPLQPSSALGLQLTDLHAVDVTAAL
jgi:hypothetical protein